MFCRKTAMTIKFQRQSMPEEDMPSFDAPDALDQPPDTPMRASKLDPRRAHPPSLGQKTHTPQGHNESEAAFESATFIERPGHLYLSRGV